MTQLACPVHRCSKSVNAKTPDHVRVGPGFSLRFDDDLGETSSPAVKHRGIKLISTPTTWRYAGDGDLFPDLSWSNRPDMTGSHAPENLQDAWVATFMAMQDVLGAVKNGNCVLIGMTAGPLVQEVLGDL